MMKQIMIFMILLLLNVQTHAQPKIYGPITEKDTLWKVASNIRHQLAIDKKVSVQQVMFALFHLNPSAFATRNVNTLKKGKYLKIPSLKQIKTFSPLQTIWKLNVHNKRWNVNPSRKSRQVLILQKRLKQEKRKTKRLQNKLSQIQSSQKIINPTVLDFSQKRIVELEDLIKAKDIHIKKLTGMLAVASENIKRQSIDNERLFSKLKEVSPAAIEALQGNSEKNFHLELTHVENGQALNFTNMTHNKD